MALYEYIVGYDRDGYTIEYRTEEIAPFGEELAGEAAEACALLAFLTYEHGLGLRSELKGRYEAEEQARRLAKLAEREEQLEAMKRRLSRLEIPVEEYVLSLEKQNKRLGIEAARLEPLQEALNESKLREEERQRTIEALESDRDRLHDELQTVEERHAEAMAHLAAEYEERLRAAEERHAEELAELARRHAEALEEKNRAIQSLKEQWRGEVSELQSTLREARAAHRALEEALEAVREEKTLCQARLTSLRVSQGLMTEEEDFTEKESFESLEKEFDAFWHFYQNQWNGAKRKIRKQYLNYEKLKGRNGQHKEP